MGTTFKNWNSLKTALQKEMHSAVEAIANKSYENLKENVEHFYDAPEGEYKRTGQLKDSPQLDTVYHSGDNSEAQISINTSTQYDPAGRDTHEIYNYAEDDGLLGYGGFWEKTMEQIENNIEEEFRKRFK